MRYWTYAIILCAALMTDGRLAAQGLANLNGAVVDGGGGAIPNASLTLINELNGSRRVAKSDSQGRYSFNQVQPANYRIEASAPGFEDLIIKDLRLPVDSTVSFEVRFNKVGSVKTTVEVSGEYGALALDDASIGNAISNTAVLEIPTFARSAASLLAYQPGVTQFNSNPNANRTDSRNGAVNGGKSDQANVTLDGADVNDQIGRYAFTSVLRIPLDSLQEFRTTTTNAGAEEGRSSGAQVSLVTKSGTNDLHGTLYEYNRSTATAANDWFNNASGLERPNLSINLFGGSVGGKIVRDRLFYFGNYEGRRDSSSYSATRIVPSALYRQGIIQYTTSSGGVAQLNPDQIRQLDPAGIGVSPAVLKLMQSYPLPNGNVAGNGLNTQSYRFNAPTDSYQNTYLARLDYVAGSRNTFFLRAQMQNDKTNDGTAASAPQFPGQPNNSVLQDNSKGLSLGWTAVLKNNLVSNFNYGLTRQAYTNNGVRTSDLAYFDNFDTLTGLTPTSAHIVPTHSIREDISWIHGPHTIRTGFTFRNVTDSASTIGGGYADGIAEAIELGKKYATPANLGGDASAFQDDLNSLIGVLSWGSITQNRTIAGSPLPESSTIRRHYVNREYEWYLEDSFRVKRNLTVTLGLRHSIMPPVFESDGIQLSTNVSLADWFQQRGILASQGLPQSSVTPLAFQPVSFAGSRPLYPSSNLNFAPRGSLAWSPDWLGGAGKTTIRAGAGMFYDLFGRGIIAGYEGHEPGLSTFMRNQYASVLPATGPRFTSSTTVPPAIIPQPTAVTFPYTTPLGSSSYDLSINDKIKAPYTVNLDFAINHDFGRGYSLQTAYVGRLSHRSLALLDLAAPTNLRDPQSGQTYYQATKQIVTLLQANTPIGKVPAIPFWEHYWAGANGLTASQFIYQTYQNHDFGLSGHDYSDVLLGLDSFCYPACGKLGPNTMFNSQYAGLQAFSSIGKGSYHSLQVSLRKRMTSGLLFDANYTFSKSIDLSSNAESENNIFLNQERLIPNTWSRGQNKAVSNYDATHIFSGYAFWQVPVGRGKAFASNMPRLADGFLGGWELAPTMVLTSGLPVTILNDNFSFPTNNFYSGWATWTGQPVKTGTTKTGAGANLFPNPAAAASAFTYTLAGDTGNRNDLRGDGNFSINLGVYKRVRIPRTERQSLQIRAEAYNLTNSVRFDVNSLYLAPNHGAATGATFTSPNFGKYSSTLTTPRQMQFAIRYSF